MEMNDLQPIILPGIPARRPLVIAGPCSAETEEQVLAAARALAAQEVKIFRAGILAVDKGQTEAARSLGLSSWQAMRLVVLPQAIKNVLPALANELVTMVKESSICSMLGMAEIMFAAKTIAGSTGISLAPYTLAALVYFCINYPASKGIEAIERRMRRGDKQ